MRKSILPLFVLLLSARLACAATCPAKEVTANRAGQGSDYDLTKVRKFLNHSSPQDSDQLILVTAHRGDWETCPENTIEGAMVAMDKKAELIELDIRISADGVPYLAHDWDFRGEAVEPDPNYKDSTVNNVYLLQSRVLQQQQREKIDRFGMVGLDSSDKKIIFPTLKDFLDVYRERARFLQGEAGIEKNGIIRGSEIVLDIKGSDGAPLKASGNTASQLQALKSVLKTVHTFEAKTKISLEQALVYKVNLKAFVEDEAGAPRKDAIYPKRLKQIVEDLQIKYDIGLIFIVYPENWNVEGGARAFYKPILEAYQHDYAQSVFGVDWQARFPGINLEQPQKDDVAAGHGVGAFVAYNPFPEGIRRSEGTCTFRTDNIQVTKDVSWKWGPPCLAQGIMQWSSAALEFFFPPKELNLPVFATNITTDMYENARNYLTITGRRNTTLILWKGNTSDKKAPEPTRRHPYDAAATTNQPPAPSAPPAISLGDSDFPQVLQKGHLAADLTLVRSSVCPSYIKDLANGNCFASGKIKAGLQGAYFNMDGRVTSKGWDSEAPLLFVDQAEARKGFTVAAELDSSQLEAFQKGIFNVFTVVGEGFDQPLFSIQRGPDGAWYAGKQIDRTGKDPKNFNTKLWDPVSPCLPVVNGRRRCTQETLYISFQSTGEVRLDDVAVLEDTQTHKKSVDWRSGLMNYGLPVVGYQPGTDTPNHDSPNWPQAKPNYMPIRGVALAALSQDFYGRDNLYRLGEYSGIRLKRFSVWASGMIGDEEIVQQDGGKWTNLTNIFRNVEKAIIADHNAKQLAAASDKERLTLTTLMSDTWLPCNTGQFQYNIPSQDLDAIHSTTQYRPIAATPCNPTGNVIPEPNYKKGVFVDAVTDIP